MKSIKNIAGKLRMFSPIVILFFASDCYIQHSGSEMIPTYGQEVKELRGSQEGSVEHTIHPHILVIEF